MKEILQFFYIVRAVFCQKSKNDGILDAPSCIYGRV